ncbi:carbohydrate kinase family protein [Halocalculus aciditolerans]|uniref:Sugar kinase n=1 Tax=Halocalculus aciditolerans TaxID=1383812 RepID=A0A830FFZ6_9EURY|nr:PfkB family carbohydrate kinase [Halocalculus aciditolerans]GGL51611.1 sugar kinase [Halocalculus aciditolerans]
MVDVVVAGHVNWDVTLRVDALPEPDGESKITEQRRAGGGSAANAASVLAGLDESVGLVGSVGDDEHGLAARRDLRAAGITLEQLVVVPDAETSVKYLVVAPSGEVMVLGNDGANEAVEPGDVERSFVADAGHLHLTSQKPETAAWLASVARRAGVPVSFDPGRRLDDRDFSETLALADLVFLNGREAQSIGIDALVDAGTVVAVKRGEGGAILHTSHGTVEHPGFSVDTVDTTGAGDAFAAGFVHVTLAGGGPREALAYANACGALATASPGARTAPSANEVAAFLDERAGR